MYESIKSSCLQIWNKKNTNETGTIHSFMKLLFKPFQKHKLSNKNNAVTIFKSVNLFLVQINLSLPIYNLTSSQFQLYQVKTPKQLPRIRQSIQKLMQVDITKTKSRSYNYFLRHFHMGLKVLAIIFSTHILKDHQNCPEMFNKLVLPLSIILTLVNLSFMVYFICRSNFPRYEFFTFMSINVVICSVIGLLTYSYQSEGSKCGKHMIEQTYIVWQIIFIIPICLLILFAKFSWAQRYSNSPGNLVWTITIIAFAQEMSFLVQVQIVAWLTGLICVGTLLINSISLVTGLTQNMKRIIVVGWVISLVLTLVCILVMLMVFFNSYSSSKQADKILSDICLKYVLVGIIDMGFWVWGLLTVSYENGDLVRIGLFSSHYDAEDQNDEKLYEIGDIIEQRKTNPEINQRTNQNNSEIT